MPLNVGLSSCGSLCQHPGCWDAVRKREKGITKSLPPLDSSSSSDDSDSELSLPTQSVCNLLSELGESPRDRYPLSTSGRPSHQWDGPVNSGSLKSKAATLSPKKLEVPHNTKASLFSKGTSIPRQRHYLPRMEVQEVFDCTDLNSQWDETFMTKQYYIWVANPHRRKRRRQSQPLTGRNNQNAPVLVKDMTESMVPSEIEQQREDTVLFDEWPVLKKRQPRTGSPPSKPIHFKKPVAPPAILPPPPSDIDMEGINELLALPKDVLVKVLENTKKSDFTSKGKLHSIVQECVQENESARLCLSTQEFLKQNKMNIHKIPKGSNVRKSQPTPPKPVFQLDDDGVIECMSSANTPVKDKACSDDDSSIESFPRYTKPLPNIRAIAGHPNSIYHLSGPGHLTEVPDSVRGPPIKAKLPSISLGLPELPSGVRTTKAFAYNVNNKNMVDFTLGPMISPPSTVRSSYSGDYSEHGTTIKVNAPLSGHGYMEMLRDNDVAIHSVSPALSTHVPFAPAGTPATFMSPTKSAPNMRDISRDPTQVTINLSLLAQPSSKDLRETTLLSSPNSNAAQLLMPAVTPALDPMTPDDKALDTIRETAREAGGVEGSVASTSLVTFGDKVEEAPRLVLQTSTLTNINTGVSPLPKSARSIESCPSPEQWPLISELSLEKMLPRSSISEPALSGRSGRRSLHRGQDDGKGMERDFARKVLDEKITAESPAPPPPSPEPKDSNEYRARKDIKSRESLSMAPLFEVNEIDETAENDENKLEQDGRRKQVRKIHAVIPQAKTENDNKKIESEESEEIMVSQMTVTHVAPKGARAEVGSNEQREKVQETFLNVDIPAEEISSCRAEHGSSRQEDISSTNESGGKSEVTTTDSQVSTSTAAANQEKAEEEGDVKKEDENEIDEVNDPPQTDRQLSLEESQYLQMQSDNIHRDRIDSGKLNSEDSGVSPELVCDSARFLSHDLVSPMEGDIDGAELQMMSLLQIVEGTAEDPEGQAHVDDERIIIGQPADGEEQETKQNQDTTEPELENQSMEIVAGESKGSDSVLDSSAKGREQSATSKETEQSDDLEPPGSFFFQPNGADTQQSAGEVDDEDKEIVETESNDIVDKSEIEKEQSLTIETSEGNNLDTEMEATAKINQNEENQPTNNNTDKENPSLSEEKGNDAVVEKEESSLVIEKESSSVVEDKKESSFVDTNNKLEGDSKKDENDSGETVKSSSNENGVEKVLVKQNKVDFPDAPEQDGGDDEQKDLETTNEESKPEDKMPPTDPQGDSEMNTTLIKKTENDVTTAEESEIMEPNGDE